MLYFDYSLDYCYEEPNQPEQNVWSSLAHSKKILIDWGQAESMLLNDNYRISDFWG